MALQMLVMPWSVLQCWVQGKPQFCISCCSATPSPSLPGGWQEPQGAPRCSPTWSGLFGLLLPRELGELKSVLFLSRCLQW